MRKCQQYLLRNMQLGVKTIRRYSYSEKSKRENIIKKRKMVATLRQEVIHKIIVGILLKTYTKRNQKTSLGFRINCFSFV